MKNIILTIGLLVSILSVGNGQDFSSVKLNWTVDHVYDLTSNQERDFNSYFVSSPSDSTITWYQKGGTVVFSFQITSSVGSWTDVSTDGSILLNVIFNGTAGTVNFSRSPTGASITANFSGSDPTGMNNRFRVTTVITQ